MPWSQRTSGHSTPPTRREVLTAPSGWIEGRRGKIYRGVSRRSRRDEVHVLGRALFELAGPLVSKVNLY